MPRIIENLSNDIIEKAIEIIVNEGIEKLSIRRLASELGVAASTIYTYYESKEQIISAIAMNKWEETLSCIDEMCDSDLSEVEILSMIADRIRVFFKPLFVYHFASVSKLSIAVESVSPHKDSYKKKISDLLCERVENLLSKREHEEADIREMAPVLTNLIVLSLHSDDLNIKELMEVMKKLF